MFHPQLSTAYSGNRIAPSLSDLEVSRKAFEIDADLAANAVAVRAHALRVVERKDVGIADEWLADPRVQQPQHGIDIGNRPHRRVRSAAQALLIDDNRHTQVLDGVGFRLGIAGQEVRTKVLKVSLSWRRASAAMVSKTKRRFAGPGDASKDGDFRAWGCATRHSSGCFRVRRVSQYIPGTTLLSFCHLPNSKTNPNGQKGQGLILVERRSTGYLFVGNGSAIL